MLDADIVSVHDLFNGRIQYTVPVYQRHYVWNKDEQWIPLWRDIMERVEVNYAAETPQARKPHFTGAIVTEQVIRTVAAVPGHYIIDGQQRLTTFQIILAAIAEVCNTPILEDIAGQALEYLINAGLLRDRENRNQYRKADEKYKLIPTQRDKKSFEALIDGHPHMSHGLLKDAYDFFVDNVRSYMKEKGPDIDGKRSNNLRHRMTDLLDAVLHDFMVAQIVTDADADPEIIFESINARGRTLNEFDHLRNNIFLKMRVSPEDIDENEQHRKHWLHFEDDFWAKELGEVEGLESERFLQYFLMAKLKKDSIAHRDLFYTYDRKYRATLAEDRAVDFELLELKKYSQIYRIMVDCQYDSSDQSDFHSGRRMKLIAQRMQFYKDLKITNVYPFILFLENELKIDYNEFKTVFDILESYTMRRLLLCKNTRIPNYSKLFAEILIFIDKTNWNSVDLVKYLSTLESNEKWPDDLNDVRNALAQCGDDSFNRVITRYILYRIENLKASSASTLKEALEFSNQLTIEHVMPKEWRSNWLKSESLDPDTAKERDLAKFSIGNLTLLTEETNKELGNQAFSQKRETLWKDPDLKITQEIVYESMSPIRERKTWDIAEIRAREGKLWKCFCEELWRDASSFMNWHYGVLKNWHPAFTDGFIIDEDGQEIPVHSSEFQHSDIPSLRKGTKVQFAKVPSEDGFKAVNVVKIV